MDDKRPKDPNEVGALWAKTGKKGPYLSGTVNGQDVVCFPVDSTNPKAPAWRVLKSQPREQATPSPRRTYDEDARPGRW